MSASTAVSAFALLFVAELGDKTQLVAISLAHRYRPLPVLAGICLAFVVLDVVAVAVGGALHDVLPERWLLLAAGVLFVGFGVHSWLGSDTSEEDGASDARRGAVRAALTSFALVFVAELGDKTQLVLVAAAASTGDLLAVLIGGTLALWTVAAIGVLAGATVLRRLPARRVHQGAALLFLAFGAWALARAAAI